MASIEFKEQIAARQSAWIARRRDLHQHPETAFEEVRTAGIVAAELSRLGLEVRTGVGKTGVVGLLEGDQDGPTILVRADMDALPVQEENETEYASAIPGKMHGCGHDGHTAIALAVAELLSGYRDRIAGRVKFVFQPAEEIGQGAAAMIADGALKDPTPDYALGLHLWNEVPVGRVALIDGPMMAASNDVRIVIDGQGGHGGLPQETHDPVVAAAQIITALQTVVSRNIHPTEVAVLSITSVQAGNTYNVIPSQAVLRGTLRAFDMAVRDTVEERLRQVATGIAAALGCTAQVVIKHLTLPVINTPEVNASLAEVFRRAVPELELIRSYQTMAAEDMSYFLDEVPGTFFFVGSANPARGLDYPHHHPRFDFDEAAIPLAVNLMASAVASYVIPE